MSRRCRPGMRARIIGGSDAGKVVVVLRRYSGEAVGGSSWTATLYPWVVMSCSGPLRVFFADSGREAWPSLTVVLDDTDLEPLDDDQAPDESDVSKEQGDPALAAGSRRLAERSIR